MYSVALVMAFHAAESENRSLKDFPRADFGRVPEKISFVGEEKTTPIIVFVMIQRIFTSWALAPTLFTIFYSGIVDTFTFTYYESGLFLSVKGYFVYMINKIIHACL